MRCELKTERLLLRPLGPADFDAVRVYAADPVLTRYMIFFPHESEEETAAFLENAAAEWKQESPAVLEFAVMLGDALIGAVSLYLKDDELEKGDGELGWILRKLYWGGGYACEAARAVIDFAGQTFGLVRIVAHCDARNEPSRRLMERLGMRPVDGAGTRTYPKTGEAARELTYVLPLSCPDVPGDRESGS